MRFCTSRKCSSIRYLPHMKTLIFHHSIDDLELIGFLEPLHPCIMSFIPGNGVYVVQGEMSILLTAMRRGARWSSHSHLDEENDILIKGFSALKDVLNSVGDLRALDPLHFLEPFLEVIKSEETTGPVTSLALSSVCKFLSYGLIDPGGKSVPAAVERIADAVTHARFVGTDQASDGVVLMKILQVLRTLVLSSIGVMLTNDSVCEIMLSCLRICFEVRLSELLRRCAEHYLKDMVQLLFTRLPYFSEDLRKPINMKKLKMRSGSIDQSRGKRKMRSTMRKTSKTQNKIEDREKPPQSQPSQENLSEDKVNKQNIPIATTSSDPIENKDLETKPQESTTALNPGENTSETQGESDLSQDTVQSPHDDALSNDKSVSVDVVPQCTDEGDSLKQPQSEQTDSSTDKQIEVKTETEEIKVETKQEEAAETGEGAGHDSEAHPAKDQAEPQAPVSPILSEPQSPESAPQSPTATSDTHEWYNSQGVRFTPQEEGAGPLIPYGVLCVRELFRFLVSLCNPLNKENTEVIIHTGLTLLTVALEVGADAIGKYATLLTIVKDDLCRNLFMLLNSERLSIFAANLQLSFLLFESLRTHLKFQLELFLSRLSEIIVSDNPKINFEQKELALECVVQLWRIPGLVTELYLNYDCDLYCPNVYEDLTKLLSKNAFPVTGVYSTHLLSLDALLTIIDTIEHHCNSRILNEKQVDTHKSSVSEVTVNVVTPSCVMVSRQKVSQNIPSHEQLMAIKRKKKLLATGTEHFNVKPKKGIQFLQEHHILSPSLEPVEVVQFLKENPHLDKKMIGEYISSRNNLAVLDAFVKSFDFTDLRIDEALRLYLETFRLPGESPLISLLMEHFADHWHKCNGEPFANADAAFTLAYAVIMLNVDQHNHNVKRQNNPMTADEFKRNLKKVNGGQDFDQDMLDDIYLAIKNEEIVMPAEQTGLVRDNYLWKVLLRRGEGKDGVYIHAPNGLLDHDLFSLIWGPTVAALSFMFDKSHDATIYQKAISGFRKCAMISAHYGMSNDFDNLIVSLCKFTMLVNSNESPDSLTISFGSNPKAMLAANTVFNLAHRHGDIIREGWKNVLDCIFQLYRCKLLPKILVEAEDFIDLSGKISLMREEIQLSQKTETGLLSSIYSYISLGSEISSHRVPSPEDQDYIRQAQACIRDCHLEHLITESKFLRSDSLHELVKALIHASYGPEGHISLGTSYNEDTAVFFLELLLKVVIQNRDRVNSIWQSVRDHIYTLLMGAAACDHHFLVERSVVGLLRLAIRLMRREDMSPVVLQSLRMLLLLKASTLSRVARQVSYGLYELLKTSAANIHSATDWAIIFTLLECVGAGAPPPRVVGKPSHHETGAKSDGEVALNPKFGIEEDSGLGNERGCTSDSELSLSQNIPSSPNTTSPELSPNTGGGWIMVGREGDIQPLNRPMSHMFSAGGERDLASHDPFSLVKCCESLAFLVRDVAHITPYNFENCVHCIRTFVEASLESSSKSRKTAGKESGSKQRRRVSGRKKEETRARSPTSAYDADESDSEELPSGYHQVPIQLLDLMHTLHTRTAQIYRWWAEENAETELTSLWAQGWCPLLQGISRLCCDTRKQVRMSAITYLQRALLVHDLQTLNGDEWESCFNKVLFPLLSKLLEPMPNNDHSGLEETRMRAATLLSKVFLHHLTPLQSLPTFTSLWMRILDYMDKYMHVDKSDLLYEAIPESLKNMLLVMDSAGVFSTVDSSHSPLWPLTWDRINAFLPYLQQELVKSHPPPPTVPHGGDSADSDPNKPASPDHAVVPSTSLPPQIPLPQAPVLQTPLPRSESVVSPTLPPTQNAPVARQAGSTTIFPHMGQLVSTPIGPPNLSPPPVILPPAPLYPIPPMPLPPPAPPASEDPSSSLPVYDGFATIASEPAIPPSAQFFFQDVVQTQGLTQSSSSPPSSGGGILLENTVLSSLPIIAPPDS